MPVKLSVDADWADFALYNLLKTKGAEPELRAFVLIVARRVGRIRRRSGQLARRSRRRPEQPVRRRRRPKRSWSFSFPSVFQCLLTKRCRVRRAWMRRDEFFCASFSHRCSNKSAGLVTKIRAFARVAAREGKWRGEIARARCPNLRCVKRRARTHTRK